MRTRRYLKICLILTMLAILLVAYLPVVVSASREFVSIEVGNTQLQPDVGKPAYQVLIPEGEGAEAGLRVFPPKLQLTGKDDWLAVQSPQGFDVSVGTYTYDADGDQISVNPNSGTIYVRASDGVLIITAGALSDKCKYDIEILTGHTLYGGETVWNAKKQKFIVTELRAIFKSYVYGSGSDLYKLENTPQNQEAIKREVKAIRVYAIVVGTVAKSTASTRIRTGGKKYNGTIIDLSPIEQRIGTTYTTNPDTGLPWTWQDIDDLQAGVNLKTAECSYVYVEVELVVHSQTFYPITPVEVAHSTIGWLDADVSSYVPAGATGVVLHLVNKGASSTYAIGLRKNGSTDDRYYVLAASQHCWAAIGVDANRIFEVYAGSTTFIDVYVVGYTMSGVTFFTNAYDKSLSSAAAWTDINCSAEAPSAIGLIWEMVNSSSSWYYFGMRKNGSSDARLSGTDYHQTFGIIIGCDASQICEGWIEHLSSDFYLVGYITDGCTFNTNATNVSLGSTGSWIDLTALPATSVMGFIEVTGNGIYGLRKDGSAEEIYYSSIYHPWAFVECLASNLVIEGKISTTSVDFFVVGYATAGATYDYTNTPDNITMNSGNPLTENTVYWAIGHTPDNPIDDAHCTFTLTSTGSATTDIDMHGHSTTGGTAQTLVSTSPIVNEYRIKIFLTGANPGSGGTYLTTSDVEMISNLAAAGHTHWDLTVETGGTSATTSAASAGVIMITGRAP